MRTNIEKFGHLVDDGDSDKRTFVIDDLGDWKAVRIEISTDDCDRKHAMAFKKALIKLWNSQK